MSNLSNQLVITERDEIARGIRIPLVSPLLAGHARRGHAWNDALLTLSVSNDAFQAFDGPNQGRFTGPDYEIEIRAPGTISRARRTAR